MTTILDKPITHKKKNVSILTQRHKDHNGDAKGLHEYLNAYYFGSYKEHVQAIREVGDMFGTQCPDEELHEIEKAVKIDGLKKLREKEYDDIYEKYSDVYRKVSEIYGTSEVKISGTWKDLDSVHVKVSGVWKEVETAWIKDSGVWKIVHSDSYVPLNMVMHRTSASSTPSGWTQAAALNGYYTIVGATHGASGSTSHSHGTSDGVLYLNDPSLVNRDYSLIFANWGKAHNHTGAAHSNNSCNNDQLFHQRIPYYASGLAPEIDVNSAIFWVTGSIPSGWSQEAYTDGCFLKNHAFTFNLEGGNTLSAHTAETLTSSTNSSLSRAINHVGTVDTTAAENNINHAHSLTHTHTHTAENWYNAMKYFKVLLIGPTSATQIVPSGAYALSRATSAPTGWTDETSTYEGMYIRLDSTSDTKNTTATHKHLHSFYSGSTSVGSFTGKGHTVGASLPVLTDPHTHSITGDSSSNDVCHPTIVGTAPLGYKYDLHSKD